MKLHNKFNIKEFKKLDELEDILHKGNRWRLGLVWICGILFILNCVWYDKVEWLTNMKYPWSLLLLFALLFIDIVRISGKCPVCKRKMSIGCFTKNRHCIIVHYCQTCKIYGKTGVKL